MSKETPKKRGCLGRVFMWSLYALGSLFAISILFAILQGIGESAGVMPTRTPRPTPTATLPPTPTPTIEEIKASAAVIPFKDLARNTETHVDAMVHYGGEVVQVSERSGGRYVLRVNVTRDEHGFWSDTVWVNYQSDSIRLLDDDVIEMWAVVDGRRSYESIFGQTITLPELTAKIIELKE